MIRQPEYERLHRLTLKTLDQVFIARVREGLGCSLFEAQSLTELVQEVYFPWLAQTEALQAGQLLMTAVSAGEAEILSETRLFAVYAILSLARIDKCNESRFSFAAGLIARGCRRANVGVRLWLRDAL